jgi:hypothetical protein
MTGIDGLDKVLDAIDLGHQVGKVGNNNNDRNR